MSIRNINKNHLKEHAGVKLVTSEDLTPPDHENPLKFWTHHETENTLVDLTVFAEGELKRPKSSGRWAGSFTGRPKLIHQMAPAIQTITRGCASTTLHQYIQALRQWWRLFDAVEQAAAEVETPMDRVEDVRQLSLLHLDFFHRNKKDQSRFYSFYRIANETLKRVGASELYWKAPEEPKPKRHLPPEDQIKALRIALKQEWVKVRQHWALLDRVRTNGYEPQTDEESNVLKHWRHIADVQRTTGKLLPSSDELRGGIDRGSFRNATGLIGVMELRHTIFPNRWDAETAFHLCLANTGWNPSVLYSLDASTDQSFLHSHPRDPKRYLLTGIKMRAGGKEQPVSGLWKTTTGPGFIIRAWMERTAPLRDELETKLMAERNRYAEMAQEDASADELTRLLKNIQQLETGARSAWLFINRTGEIEWLDPKTTRCLSLNGKPAGYMEVILDRLNRERAACNKTKIEAVTPSDFRDIFSLYVWRMSGGNILALMRALNHAHLRTTDGYVDTNILNAERDHQARTFLDHLFNELGKGRVDISILAHLQRHGAVSKESAQRLNDFRAYQRSRMGVACKDPFHPPKDIQPESIKGRMCGPQRCLICKTNAIILPESMSGIAMRVEELEVMQNALAVGVWLESQFPDELRNGLDVLRLFPPEEVRKAREEWKQAIKDGSHHIPGLHQASYITEA